MARASRPPAPSRARQALYRDLVLEAAEATFAEHGVESSKMEQIAEASGLSLGTVYAAPEPA